MERPSFESTVWKQEEEPKAYREAMAQSLLRARAYNGTEASYEELVAQLVTLEQVAKESPSLKKEDPIDREAAAALSFTPTRPRDIQNILDVAIDARNKVLHNALVKHTPETISATTEKQSPLLMIHVNGVLIPTNPRPLPASDQAGQPFEAVRIENRMRDVMSILDKLNVHIDDLIVVTGNVDKSMMRELSYAAIRIPRINRAILVCDQVSEATFVLRGDIGSNDLLNKNKEELREHFGKDLRKLVRRADDTNEGWKEKIELLLSTDSAWDDPTGPIVKRPLGQKIKVATLGEETLTSKLAAAVGSPEKWITMNSLQRRDLSANGLYLTALTTIFGIQENALQSKKGFFQMGLLVFPNDPTIKKALEIATRTPLEWRAAVAAKITPEQWVTMTQEERRMLDFDGIKLRKLSAVLGEISTNWWDTKVFLNLGLAIFPDNKLIKEKLAIENRTPEEWRNSIREAVTANEWLEMTKEDHSNLSFDGWTLSEIAALFGITGGLTRHGKPFLQLGAAIFPEDPAIKKELLMSERTLEEWRVATQAKTTPEKWLAMSSRERRDFDVDGRKFTMLCSMFGIPSTTKGKVTAFLLLGQAIFPDSALIKNEVKKAEAAQSTFTSLENRTPEEWRNILSQKFTPESWLKERRAEFNVDNFTFPFLLKKFGIKNKVRRNVPFLELGLAIFPDNQLIKQALNVAIEQEKRYDLTKDRTRDEWRAAISQKVTSADWVSMPHDKWRTIDVDDHKLSALAKIFGFTEKVHSRKDEFLKLGLTIWPDDPLIKKALEEIQG